MFTLLLPRDRAGDDPGELVAVAQHRRTPRRTPGQDRVRRGVAFAIWVILIMGLSGAARRSANAGTSIGRSSIVVNVASTS